MEKIKKLFNPLSEQDIKDLEKLKEDPCDCGAKYCKKSKVHYDWCSSLKNEKKQNNYVRDDIPF